MLGTPSALLAHRLEGLEQSSLVDVQPDGIAVQVTLALGADIAPRIAALLDPNGDDTVSPEELAAWNQNFLAAQSIALDGKSLPLQHRSTQHSSLAEMRRNPEGHAEIRMGFIAPTGTVASGPHSVTHKNGFAPIPATYQAHGIMPKSPAVSITKHTRRNEEREITLEFAIASGATSYPSTANSGKPLVPWWAAVGSAIASGVLWARARRKGNIPNSNFQSTR
jgi:hypothetical protein